MTPHWLDVGLILFAFGSLPLGVGGFFVWRAVSAYAVRQNVLRELVDLLALACRRNLPFPEVLEGFAESLADRGATTPVGRFSPGQGGRMSEASQVAFAFAAESRQGGLPSALGGAPAAKLVPEPFLGWLQAGYARGSLSLTLETIRDQLRFDRRRKTWFLPLFAYVSFALIGCALIGEGAISVLRERFSPLSSPDFAWRWVPPLLALGWYVLILVVIPLRASRARSRNRVLEWIPGIGSARRLRAWASRLRMLECSLRAGLTSHEALTLLAEGDDPVAAQAARRVGEGEGLLQALGLEGGQGTTPLPELVAELAGDYERKHAARCHSLALASLPLGLAVVGLWVFTHHYQFFSAYGDYLRSELRPW